MDDHIPTSWRDVFDSQKVFPADYSECRTIAKNTGYKYFGFNGIVFSVNQIAINYQQGLCGIDDLKD